MKKFNFKIITFIIASLLIVGGWFSTDMGDSIHKAMTDFIKNPSIGRLIDDIDEASKEISYKENLIDIYSFFSRVTNTRFVKKTDATIVRMKNDYLAFDERELSSELCDQMADSCAELKAVTDSLEIPLLYVMAPTKLYFENEIEGVAGIAKQNYVKFSSALETRGMNVLDLAEKMSEQGLSMEEQYFITDHHWTPETGLWASGEICKELKRSFGFSYDEALLDISNYSIRVYEDWFLGSAGKKTGRYFSSLGVDDISLLLPKFETELALTDRRGTFSGTFENSVIDMSHLSQCDYYKNNAYAAYSGGDFGLQKIENKLDEEGKETLIIRDSFACVVTPFISLTTDMLHVADVRYWDEKSGADTILKYIQAVKPDYVVILYSMISPEMVNFG